MSPRSLRWTFRGLAASFLIGCGGDNPSGPQDAPNPSDPVLPSTPNPASVSVTPEPTLAASSRITTAGGTLEATGSDGTVYELTIPADALLSDTTITLVPLAGVSGLDLSGGRFLGVQLEPDGLRLFQPATLRVSPPEGSRHSAMAFTYHGTGAEVFRSPLTPSPDVLEASLLHFSGHLVYVGDGIRIPAAVLTIVPTEWEDRFQSFLEELLRAERERALTGEEPDPDLGNELLEGFRAYYDNIVGPSLNRMMTDCSYAQTAVPRAFAWERQVELWGLGGEFSAEESKIMNAALAALQNCFRETVGDCLDNTDPEQMEKAARYSRQLELLGNTDPAYNVLNEDLYCSDGWAGTTTRTRDLYGTGSRDVVIGNVEWELAAEKSFDGVSYYRVKSGSIEWRMEGTDNNGCTVQGGPQTFELTPDDGELVLDGNQRLYSGAGVTLHYTTVTVTCPAPLRSYTPDWSVSDWLSIPPTPMPMPPIDDDQLVGTFDFPGLNTTYEWNFTR